MSCKYVSGINMFWSLFPCKLTEAKRKVAHENVDLEYKIRSVTELRLFYDFVTYLLLGSSNK